MKVSRICIDDRAFGLDSADDLDALRQQVIHAVRTGGAFAEFRSGGRDVSVLITSEVRIQIETTECSDETADAAAMPLEPSVDDDLDSYLNYGEEVLSPEPGAGSIPPAAQ